MNSELKCTKMHVKEWPLLTQVKTLDSKSARSKIPKGLNLKKLLESKIVDLLTVQFNT